jgi:hypothetical protein
MEAFRQELQDRRASSLANGYRLIFFRFIASYDFAMLSPHPMALR